MELEQKVIKEKSSLNITGAVISVIVAHLCCVTPLILLTLGASGSWVSGFSVLEPYKPIFLTLTFLFMAFAFYNRYLKRTETKTCITENDCSTVNRKNSLVFWGANTFIVFSLAFPYISPYFFSKDLMNEKMEMGTKKIVLSVEKMTCLACPPMVSKSLMQLKGIKDVKVTLNPPEAQIVYEPGKVSPENMIQATTKAGHPSFIK